MSVRTIFANESGQQPASQLDNMFSDVWNAATLPCTVTGTNALTLTPRTNANLPTAYVPNQRVAFTATITSTGSVTAQIGSLSLLNVYQPGGTQAGAGNIVINTLYELVYDANLNSGAGGWWLVSATATATAVAQPVQGSHKNLKITNGTGAPSSQVTVTADQVMAQNSSGGTVKISSLNVTISTASTGANGLDSGTVAVSTFYSVWAIYNPTTATAAGLLSTSATSPALPSGYTYSARLGWVLTDGSANVYRFNQLDREFQFVVGTNPANIGAAPFLIANGTVGTYSSTSPTLAATSVTGIVPSTALSVKVVVASDWKNAGTAATVAIAPNVGWGGSNNGPAGSNGNTYPVWIDGALVAQQASLTLETTSIAIASVGAGAAVQVIGWTDNL